MRYSHRDEGIGTLASALSDHMRVDGLRKLAALTGQKLPTRKDDLVQVILKYLEGDRLRIVWEGLDGVQRAAVAEVVHSESTRFQFGRFRAKYSEDPKWDVPDKKGHTSSPTPLCLFFCSGRVMPDDIKERLKAFVPPPAEAQIETLDSIPSVFNLERGQWNPETKTSEMVIEQIPIRVWEMERSAQRELASVLRLVDAGKVVVSDKTRRPSTAAMTAISAILDGGDFYPHIPPRNPRRDENAGPIRAFAWPLILQAGGIARISGTKLQLTKSGRESLASPASETISSLWADWMGADILDELSRMECVKGQTGRGKRGLTDPCSRRDAIAQTLIASPPGRWISVEEFFRYARALGHDFSVTHDAWHLYIGEQNYGALGCGQGVRVLDERYVLCLLLEYAATLGLIDVALIPPSEAPCDFDDLWGADDLFFFSRYDGLRYFRITRLGAYCLGVAPSYEPEPMEVRPVLSVLPNLEIAAIGVDLEPGDRLALDAYATRVSDRVWRLDEGRLLSAIDEGRSADEILGFLSARSSNEIPNTVSRLIEDVADRSQQVIDRGPARLVECADPALAALIANDTRTRKHCLRAGDRHLVVPGRSETRFRRSLREVGYLLATRETRSEKIGDAMPEVDELTQPDGE